MLAESPYLSHLAALAEWRDTLEIARCAVARTDGLSAVAAWVEHEALDTIVHIDPFDPELVGGDGRSALDLAEHLVERGTGLVYWYGYDNPSRAAWAYKRLARDGASVWCADAMITDSHGGGSGGDLGIATTPGVGCGVVLANIGQEAIARSERRVRATVSIYTDVALPTGEPGAVRLTSHP